MKLKSTRYSFEATDGTKWDVIINAAKRGDNTFRIYENGTYRVSYTPNGGNASATAAKYFVLNHIQHKPKQ